MLRYWSSALNASDGSAVGNEVGFGEVVDVVDPIVSMANEVNGLTLCSPRVVCDGNRGL